jgi:HK97 family phage major capsid protein
VKPTSQIDVARQSLADSVEKMQDWDTKAQALPDDADEKEVQFVRDAFEAATRETKRWQETLDRLGAIAAMRDAIPADDTDDEPKQEREFARPRGSSKEPRTYSAQTSNQGRSFFGDLVNSIKGDGEARQRLERHTTEVAYEKRAISTTVTAGGNFVPPEYLGELYAGFPRAGRPFADAIPVKLQHNAGSGMNVTIPRITTGTTEDVIITENSTTVSSTDIVEALLTIPVRTIAGQQDVSQQLLDHSQPGIDQVIFADLRSAYDTKLDSQLLNGTGLNGQHLGIRAVSGVNAITYTQATPTAALTVPPIYNAIQSVESNRYSPADLLVWHPRRSAFMASNLSSTFPLFQLGGLYQAAGTQDVGMVESFSGLRAVRDANVRTTDGAGTNQDEVYVLRSQDLILWEGELQARVMEQVLSNTLTVRLQLFAYSAFASGRYPKSISVISGTGLAAPSF